MARGFDTKTTLGACWSKKERSWMIYFPRRPDGWFMYAFMQSDAFQAFAADLAARGYDTETLRISIKKSEKE